MNNWMWDNLHEFGNRVDRSNPQTTSWCTVENTGELFSWYGSDHLRGMIEPPSCWQCKPLDFQAIRQLNWDAIIDEDFDDDNWADPGAPNRGMCHPGVGNENDDSESEEAMQGGENETGKGKGTKDGKGKGKVTEDGKGKGKVTEDGKGRGNGRGREMVNGKVLLNTPQEEMTSLVPLHCSWRMKCQRQKWTQRAKQSGYTYSRKQLPPCQYPQMMIPTLQSWMANMT